MRCVLIFGSVHVVMRSEKILKEKGVSVDLIPVPREVSSDCGVAVEIPVDRREEALSLLEEKGITIVACFLKENGRFKKE
ncbi:MAG: hypothetical protein A2170_16585 [Deltaproteobacteria bacterium RBG_13_53_10]|nr:MAG: hypothetical protein A2170_16585 [Deltaproteobacteria bacterium RBG_13_53_10]